MRFHVLPWELEEAPADRFAYYCTLLGNEADVSAATRGMGMEDRFMDEYDEDCPICRPS